MRKLLLPLALLCASCAGPSNDVFLVGQVYDGATGERLTAYKMTVLYRDQTITADVAPDGRFLVKNLPVYMDYTVEIDASGYRAFRSHSQMFNIPNPGSPNAGKDSTTQTFYFDAYLFPSNLVAAAATFPVRKDLSTGDPANGKARIRPIAPSVLSDTTQEMPAGVGTQLWTNDEDLQAKPLDLDFTGQISIDEGALVYGVRYLITIYGVDGYQPFEQQITAGVDGSRTLVLTPETSDPLMMLSTTANNCLKPTSPSDTQAAVVSFSFNLDIELSATANPGGWAEYVDDNFTMTSFNTNGDANLNTFVADVSSNVQEHGTTTTVSGKTITFAWNPSLGLATKDPADTFTLVRWNVGSVQVQPIGKSGQKQFLSTFFPNASFISCN